MAIQDKTRAAGMAAPLPASNIGYKLMARMGYKAGSGLGAQGEGKVNPVPVVLKRNRGGVGEESAAMARVKEVEKQVRALVAHNSAVESSARKGFQAAQSASYASRHTTHVLRSASLELRSLDEESGVVAGSAETERVMWYGAPEMHPAWERLQEHLATRSTAGARSGAKSVALVPYDPAAAAAATVSATTGAGGGGVATTGVSAEDEVLDELEAWGRLPPSARLELVLQELRTVHRFCTFCGMQYSSASELAAKCPGVHEKQHE